MVGLGELTKSIVECDYCHLMGFAKREKTRD